MADRFDVVVVGAGPAGLAASRRALASGARVAMLDDNPAAGGQIWRGMVAERDVPAVDRMMSARVVAAPSAGRLSVEFPQGAADLEYGALVLATGARERFLPFPGWTLPNVAGAGGLQALAKGGLPVKGKRVVVAGSGPLLLAVAKYLRDHGATIAAIAEQATHPAVVGFAAKLVAQPKKLMQAMQLRAGLAGVRYLTSCWPVRAVGDGELESVTLRRRDTQWTERCDYLACGFGLVPNLELASVLGCRIENGAVAVDGQQQTSVAHVYAAGEATGIGGLDLAIVEGEIAGLAAAGGTAERALLAERDRHRRFAADLERAFALRAELREMVTDDTLMCRCEDVTFGRVRECAGWREAKLHTRCGMGPCQGRVCGAAAEFLLGWHAESVRPPVFPARISTL
ncbi:MAG TPA: FAD/NAD(P)-binding oxidoreductase [Candidatus Limnocylindrales bacterium]|nr:FAD/NAD(P)-binding oxidoreductase [Candidatus Limnocylindrales bacterium]